MIRNVADLFKFIVSLLPELPMTSDSKSMWKYLSLQQFRSEVLPRWLDSYKEGFEHEQEWILKSQTLTVPEGSTIIVDIENQSIPRIKFKTMMDTLREAGYEISVQRRGRG